MTPTLRQLAAAAQSQNTRERIRAALWRVAEERLATEPPAEATPEETERHGKVQTFARTVSRFTDQWIPLFATRVLQDQEVQAHLLELVADSNLLSGEAEAALDAALLAAVDAVFDNFIDMPN